MALRAELAESRAKVDALTGAVSEKATIVGRLEQELRHAREKIQELNETQQRAVADAEKNVRRHKTCTWDPH